MKLFVAPLLALSLVLVGCGESASTDTDADTNARVMNASNRVEAQVDGMTCTTCSGAICDAVNEIEGVTGATADVMTGHVVVALEDDADAEAALAAIQGAIADLGGQYTVSEIHTVTPDADAPTHDDMQGEGGMPDDAQPMPEVGSDTAAQAMPEILEAQEVPEGVMVVSYTVSGMHCSACAAAIGTEIEKIEGVRGYAADVQAGTISVQVAEGTALDRAMVAKAVTDAGFEFPADAQ